MTTTNPYIAKAASTTPQTPMSVWAKVFWMVVGAVAVAVPLVIGTSIWGLNHINNAYVLGAPRTDPGYNPEAKCAAGEAAFKGSLNGSRDVLLATEGSGAHIGWTVKALAEFDDKSLLTTSLTIISESATKEDTPNIISAYLWQSGNAVASNDANPAPFQVMGYKTPPGGVTSVTAKKIAMEVNDVFFICVAQKQA